MTTIKDLETVRQYFHEVRERGKATDLRIVRVTAYLDRHFPVRRVESFFALEYGRPDGPGTHYHILGAGFLYGRFDGFLVSGPLSRKAGLMAPYATHSGSRDGEYIGIGPMYFHNSPGITAMTMRMGGLVVSERSYPETPLVPTGESLGACRVLRLFLYGEHLDSTGVPCAYSNTSASRAWETPPPCPRCGCLETRSLDPLRDPGLDSDAALAMLRDNGVVYW